MTKVVYTFGDDAYCHKKSDWGSGPWENEPDKQQWIDEETGYNCLIVRNNFGALCGYVGITETHPYFEQHYDKVDVGIHGGLTFSDYCMKDKKIRGVCHITDSPEDNIWWLGFDCAHLGDYVPGIKLASFLAGTPDTYKDFNYVINEVEYLAKQLKALE